MNKLCRWCGEFITDREVSVGFGDGFGSEFVHGHCYNDYKLIIDVIFASRRDSIFNIWEGLIRTHKILIRQQEQRLNEPRQT